jgi:maleylpyruvate isomerase
MKLYGFWRSTCTWRVRIALALKGIEHDYQPVHLLKGEQHSDDYSRKNPMQQVPVLELDDGTLLAQSMAILDYLDEVHPQPSIFPRTPLLRYRARQLAEIVTSGIQPLQNTSTQKYVREELHGDAKIWVRHFVEKGLSALEIETARSAGTFSVGDELSVADLCLVPEMYFARRFGIDLSRYATLSRVDATCAALPAFQKAHAEAQPDYEQK